MAKPNEIRLALARVLGEFPESPPRILDELESLVRGQVARERERGVALCRHRAELWAKTLLAREPAASPGREEARSRSNEARYLADLIESATDLFPPPDA